MALTGMRVALSTNSAAPLSPKSPDSRMRAGLFNQDQLRELGGSVDQQQRFVGIDRACLQHRVEDRRDVQIEGDRIRPGILVDFELLLDDRLRDGGREEKGALVRLPGLV